MIQIYEEDQLPNKVQIATVKNTTNPRILKSLKID